MNQEMLAKACKTLHLAHVMSQYESIPFENHTDFLHAILQAEIQGRESSKMKRLMKRAGFPQLKTFEGYNFEEITFPNQCTEQSMRELTFLKLKENILMLGDVR
jgi:DNA replication protein DnaC